MLPRQKQLLYTYNQCVYKPCIFYRPPYLHLNIAHPVYIALLDSAKGEL